MNKEVVNPNVFDGRADERRSFPFTRYTPAKSNKPAEFCLWIDAPTHAPLQEFRNVYSPLTDF